MRSGIMKHLAGRRSCRWRSARSWGTGSLVELDAEARVVHHGHGLHRAHHDLAEAVLDGPALDRGDAVLGRHRLVVVPFQAVAQLEQIGLAVVLHRPVGHLRVGLVVVLVQADQLVEHQIGVVLGGCSRRWSRRDQGWVRPAVWITFSVLCRRRCPSAPCRRPPAGPRRTAPPRRPTLWRNSRRSIDRCSKPNSPLAPWPWPRRGQSRPAARAPRSTKSAACEARSAGLPCRRTRREPSADGDEEQARERQQHRAVRQGRIGLRQTLAIARAR